MNILHINTERTWRGGEQQTLYLAAGLREEGVSSALACQPGVEMESRAKAAGVTVHPVKMRGEWDMAAAMALRSLMRRERFDIVHMHTSHAHTLGVIAARTGGRARTVVARRVDFSIYRHAFSMSGIKYKFGVDRYIAISNAIREVLVRDGIPRHKISMVHSGVDPARLEQDAGGSGSDRGRSVRQEFGLDGQNIMIGAVAHFAWHKGLEYLVDAVPLIVKELPRARIFLVGEGSLEQEIRARVAQRGAGGNIVFTGFRNDVPDVLDALDIFVMPSVMEGLCTSILDALVCKKPVVASRVGGIPEIIEHEKTGLLVPPRDPASLAAAIIRLAKEKELADKLAAKGCRKVKEEFSVKAMVRGTLKVYEDLLGSA